MTGAYMGVTIKVAVVVVVVMMVHDNGDINIKNGGNGLTVVDGIKKKAWPLSHCSVCRIHDIFFSSSYTGLYYLSLHSW